MEEKINPKQENKPKRKSTAKPKTEIEDTNKPEETVPQVEPKRKKKTPSIEPEKKEEALVFHEELVEEIEPTPVLQEEHPIEKGKKKNKKAVETSVNRKNPSLEEGLTTEEVQERVQAGLSNYTPKGSSKSVFAIIIKNLFTFFNMLMFAICIWLLTIQQYKDCFFMVVVLLNISIGIIQEIRAKHTMDKMSLISSPVADVVRDGDTIEIPVSDLVMDDIIFLESGKQICADAIVREGVVEVDESLLTGESDAILKKKGDTLLSGSYVISGKCKAQIKAVGKDSYIQKLSLQAKKYSKPKSDLMKSLRILIYSIAFIVVFVGSALFITQYRNLIAQDDITKYMAYVKAVKGTCGAVIGMIPSGLFLLSSVSLFASVVKLANNNTMVQELYCIEMLARVNVLCLDKTGTITDGTMTVTGVQEYEHPVGVNTKTVVSAIIAILQDKNQTAVALEQKFGVGRKMKYVYALPFASARKYSGVEFEKFGTFLMGAPEFVLKENYSLVSQDVEKYAKMGFRVLCVAHSDGHLTKDGLVGAATPFSLIVISDTIRPEAKDTLAAFTKQGVELKVISGDNPITVSKVAERAGVPNASKYIDLTGLSEKEVRRAATRYTVFGRVTPVQKKILVTELKANKNTVAMTGDGVNDILALKEADCSIAMASGSEAARNCSHLVLLDSNFANLPKVVNEGRRVINNVQRVAVMFLTKNIFSFLLAIIAITSGGTYPIATSQLFLIDTFCIGVPAFFLALQANKTQIKGKFLWNVLKRALPGALTVVFCCSIIFLLSNSGIIEMTAIEKSTLVSLVATFTCLMVLFKSCYPFNAFRRTIFCSMALIITAAVLFCSSWFDFAPFWGSYSMNGGEVVNALNVTEILLVLCLMQASVLFIEIFSNIVPFTKNLFKSALNKLNNEIEE